MFKQYAILCAVLLAPVNSIAELRDPTVPGNLPPAEITILPSGETALTLTGIWISGTNKRAMINGVSLTSGQTLADGSRILSIRPNHVLISRNGVNKKLFLVPSVKKPVK